MVVGFIGGRCAFVNMKTKALSIFEHRLPEPFKCLLTLRHLPNAANFFMLSRGGTYRVWDFEGKYQDIAKFGANLYFDDNRLFSFMIELQNDAENSLMYDYTGPPQTLVAFPIH